MAECHWRTSEDLCKIACNASLGFLRAGRMWDLRHRRAPCVGMSATATYQYNMILERRFRFDSRMSIRLGVGRRSDAQLKMGVLFLLKWNHSCGAKKTCRFGLVLVTAATLAACGRETRKKEDVKVTAQTSDSSALPPKEPPAAQPTAQTSVQSPVGTEVTAPNAPSGGAQNPDAAASANTLPSKQPITVPQNTSLSNLLKLLAPSSGGNPTNLVSQILGGSDPKLASALVACPGILLAGTNLSGLLSSLTGMVSGQTSTPAPTSTAQTVALASCLLNALK